MQLTVKQYASKYKISVQAVYQKIQRGAVEFIEKEGIKYIIVSKQDMKDIEQPTTKSTDEGIVKDLLKQLKKKDKEIKRLTKRLEKSSDEKEKVYLSYIGELKQIQLGTKSPDAIIDIGEVTGKKKSKKKKKA